MKITLDGLDGRNFTLRLPRDAGGEHVVSLHDTRALRGLYEHDAARFSLDPVEADALTGEVAWVLAEGTLHLGGPAVLGATRLDLDIRRDDATPGVTGEARCAALDAPVTRLHRAGLELYGALSFTALDARYDETAGAWSLAMEALGAKGASLARGALQARLDRLDARAFAATFGDATSVAADSLTVEGLALTGDGISVLAAGATLTGVRLTRAGDALTVEAAGVALTGVEITRGQVAVRAPSLRLDGLRYGPDGLAVGGATAESIAVTVHGLGANGDAPAASTGVPEAPTGGRRMLGVDLPLLDGVAGRVEADVVVDVKLPVIERREGTHRVRLELREGTIDFKQLERGLSALEDAVIDFEVDDAGLYLEVDAVVVKRELVRWPLDAEGVRLARQNRVRLRTFARPTVAAAAPAPRAEGEGPPSVALRRVEVRRLVADLAVKGASTLPVAGGTLRLGDGGGDALRALHVSGELVHDATAPSPETAVAVTLEGLDVGVEGMALGGRRFDLARAQVGEVAEGRVTFRGFAPTSVALDLRAVALTWLKLGAPPTAG